MSYACGLTCPIVPMHACQKDPDAPIVVFGLGNPGNEYAHTRHNIGFVILDKVAERHKAMWRNDRSLKAHVASIAVGSRSVLLAKPNT